MDPIQWYTISLGFLTILGFIIHSLRRGLHRIVDIVHKYGPKFLNKHVYTSIHHSTLLTRFHLFLFILFLIGNIFPIIYTNREFSIDYISISGNAAQMCAINLIPLVLIARVNLLTNFCSILPENHSWIHAGIGLICLFQACLHSLLMIGKTLWGHSRTWSIVVSIKNILKILPTNIRYRLAVHYY